VIHRHAWPVVLAAALALLPASARAGSMPVAPPNELAGGPTVVPGDAAARIYLSQALASLARAEQLAQQASQYGDLGSFDLAVFLEELRALSTGLQRFLVPHAPPPGPQLPIEITGQYLYDGLSRQRTPARLPSHPTEPRP
jgi:hypothetical protein